MASAPLDSDPVHHVLPLRLIARVGLAQWTIMLAAPTVAELQQEEAGAAAVDGSDTLSSVALYRVMEGVRTKAIARRCYGGGLLTIDPADLAAAPVADADGGETPVGPRWYALVDVTPVGHRDFRLIA
jgi:hypothetical protein